MTTKLPVKLRPAIQEDVPFIFNAWLRSYRTSDFARNIDSKIYYSEQHNLIERLLQKSETLVIVSETDSTQIYGFICSTKTDGILTIHYLYVKHSFRKLGLARSLLQVAKHDPSIASVYTHETKTGKKLSKIFNMFYHPYILTNYLDKQYKMMAKNQPKLADRNAAEE